MPHLRRCTAAVVLVAYVVVGLGIPVPRLVARNPEPVAASRSCCSGAGRCCCSTPSSSAPKPCCDATHARGGRGCCDTEPSSKPTGTWHVRLAPLACQCSATVWVSTGSVLPAIPTPAWMPHLSPDGWVPEIDIVGPSHQIIPPDPPPRAIA